ncbi:endonuclease V isoform X3 [Oenanthe melanoleuca]|uniref:endonuclease V isoform X3 n=1 Tax=Oenanthe melanoleuca TaxID=2939378 RepID=UPI0024C1D743|nr:endonuclease V isoform X3 [Oenanthe melanoleuca]
MAALRARAPSPPQPPKAASPPPLLNKLVHFPLSFLASSAIAAGVGTGIGAGTAALGRAFRGTAALRRCHGRVPCPAAALGTARLKASVVEQDTEQWQKDPHFSGLQRVGGVDLSYVKGDESRACASLVVLSFPALEVLYQDCRMVAVTAPYVAGFLAFREVPVLLQAVQRLQQEEPQLQPQVLLVDGNGLLHPRGFGTACHLGVLTDLPCIGVAKNLLHVDGLVRDELHREQVRSLQRSGETFPLTGTSGKVLGMVLRSCSSSSRPLYVSVGHRVSLGTAVRLVRACCRFRIPEPIRQADIRSREYLRKQPCAPLGVLGAAPASPESKKEAELED